MSAQPACREPGCPSIAAPGHAYCDEHPSQRKIRSSAPVELVEDDRPRASDKAHIPPSSAHVERQARKARLLLNSFLDEHGNIGEYRWAENIGYGTTSSGGEGKSGAGPSDQTGNIVAAGYQGYVRSNLRAAADAVDVAVQQLATAKNALARANRPPRREPLEDGGSGPPLISKAELGKARAAQRRRTSRGEGWGES